MRLIDADELIKDRVENDPVRIAVQCAPTAFDKEKVIEKIKDESSLERFEDVGISGNVYGHYSKEVIDTEEAIEIVEKGVVENEKGQSDTRKKVSAPAPYRNSQHTETGREMTEVRADHADRCGIQPGF